MTYCLDTNTCIYFLKGESQQIRKKLSGLTPSQIKIPSIVKAELLLGALKSKDKKRNQSAVLSFLDTFEILSFGNKESTVYAEIRNELESKGKPIGPNDLLIASIVLSHNSVLVTNNEREFRRVGNLRIENWL